MFKKILVANRGEIAVRIIRTCCEMGVKTVAIYSEVDAQSLHVHLADEAVQAPSVRGYLDMEFVLGTAIQTGAEAIHPGYGFLSENPVFAAKCAQAGVVFIGPEARAIELMGDKARARDTMVSAGVPVTPGTNGVIGSMEEALKVARQIGFPVLVKAVAGGGGRGMRLVRQEEELLSGIESARSEANSSFGNSEVYLEKFLEGCRHVEMQILADNYGEVVYLGERDCSIQRRNQKLIEESPSPAVGPELRVRIGQVAIAAAKAVNYCGAGTLEFLLDKDLNFYFMEMNTRIQVEHPVTELICGLDLIREQIRIAAGEPLGYDQAAIRFNGWAMECRINAEDPHTFMPSPGQIKFYRPPGGFGIRLDSALYPGCAVSPFYDSLIAKLIVHGQNRSEVIARMRRALEEFEIEGVKTTIPFHLRVLAHADFQSGDFDTGFIQQKMADNSSVSASKRNASEVKAIVRVETGEPLDSPDAEIGPEVVAVISAAITAYGQSQDQEYEIMKINTSGRGCSPWRMAGLYERMGKTL
ncbi:MAG: acetyl-CoA carboxylase biotin carboxylase subunit [Desulfitobacteriaceae bacterium]